MNRSPNGVFMGGGVSNLLYFIDNSTYNNFDTLGIDGYSFIFSKCKIKWVKN